MKRILVIDDEIATREFFTFLLEGRNLFVDLASTGVEGLERMRISPPDLVIVDLNLPDTSGIDVIKHVKSEFPRLPIIVITAYSTVDNIASLINLGVEFIFVKPFDNKDNLLETIERLVYKHGEERAHDDLPDVAGNKLADLGLIGRSKEMMRVFKMIVLAARVDSPVLIKGETGTGKELVARAIHALSKRAGEFVALNCAAIPESLFESILFGHDKGAFTGAVEKKDGLLTQADGGTLLLDEVTEMPQNIQAKFLRAIQEKRFYRVGDTKEVVVDIRVISTTNRDIDEAVAKGLFRRDLFYRLNVIRIEIPPLRERRSDIPILADYFVKKICDKFGIKQKRISPEAVNKLMVYQYPGNVRELQNIIERSIVVERGSIISKDSIQFENADHLGLSNDSYRKALEQFEKKYFIELLERTNWNVKRASSIANIHVSTLYRKLKQLGISPKF